jgi:hypothetical protein
VVNKCGCPDFNGTLSPSGSPFNHPAPEGHAKKVSEVLGEIVWLMSQSCTLVALPLRYLSAVHKQFFI